MKPKKHIVKTKLRLHLDAKKMSAQALAEKMGVSPRAIQSIAQGVREPSIEMARKIAKTLKTKLDIIFP
jgi:transcriptional regulator with XRE-family HTH domain